MRRAPGPRATLATAAATLAVACATAGTLHQARGTGVVRHYEAAWAEIWHAALRSIPANGLQLDRASEEERYIFATRLPTRAGSGLREQEVTLEADQGERIGIFLDSIGPGRWAVEVVTVRRFALDPSKLDWAPEVFWVIERELDPEGRIRLPDSAFQEPARRPSP